MNYNISKYIVTQSLNQDEILLYSTLSTSLLLLDNTEYQEIFKKHNYHLYPKECMELCEMGFLYTGESDKQFLELEGIRRSISLEDHGITAITIAPTMDCNARCYYCFEKGASQGMMTEGVADKVSEFLINNCKEKKLYIAWFGGEPLMAEPIISRITKQLCDNDIEIESTITTNGILIDERMITRFQLWNVTRVQITIDGIGEDYNRVKRYKIDNPNPFETIMCNIELLIKSDITVHLRVNYYSTNYNIVKQTMDYLHDRFGDYEKLYLYGVPLDLPSRKGYSEFDEEEGSIFLNVLDNSLKRGYENDELNFSALRVSNEYNKALGELMLAPFPASCFMVNKDRYVIDDKGYLYKCQKQLGRKEMNCGDVYSGVRINDIYNYYVTDRLHGDKCRDCNILPICQGGCKANRLLYGDKYACPPSKTIIDKLVLKYYEYIINDNTY